MAQKPIHGLTHSELVGIAKRWLRNTEKCSVVLSEMASSAGEEPDAIGWKNRMSTLVECKCSRSDFFADVKKLARQSLPDTYCFGMGCFRYYMIPEGLVKPEEVPRGWGLLEVLFDGRVRRTVESVKWWLPDMSLASELRLALSALRRYQESERAKTQ